MESPLDILKRGEPMSLPRSKYVQDDKEGVYHCFSRCVRRAYLYGHDALTGKDFSHRKKWLVDRLKNLAAIFAIEVCAYAIMENHYHSILRTRPDIAATWSPEEVATRWLKLFPPKPVGKRKAIPPLEEQIRALADRPERIEELRKRLCSLSWFMGRLNEFIAREANKEDKVKGRFWESRFKCQALLDDAAVASCMVYVDLNLIRAGLASTPENSDFTSIQERIRSWQNETMEKVTVHPQAFQEEADFGSLGNDGPLAENACPISNPIPDGISAVGASADSLEPSTGWLCPIQSDLHRRGILQMTAAEYFDLVDRSGRLTRSGKRSAIDAGLAPILLRINANPDAWVDTVSRFGAEFCLAAGLLPNLRNFADRIGRRWLKGVSIARSAFSRQFPRVA
jgi:putative transposase